ncbi:hypothetical protein JHK87_047662 [Glycine soja]|nr:hypothetical protein JHK87_047662 [Glycine soja]
MVVILGRSTSCNKYKEEPFSRHTLTEVRKSHVGDVTFLHKVFLFLEHWGLINFDTTPPSSHADEEYIEEEYCKMCLDFNVKNPTCASITYGIFLSMDCSTVHRSLDMHISFVRLVFADFVSMQRPQVDSHNNELVSVSNVAAPNLTYSNESKLNSDEDEDGWEFKSTEWETGTKSQDVKIIKECPLTQSDCGFVDFVSPYFHQFHIHSLHLGAKIHSHNFPYANLFQCVSDKFEERKEFPSNIPIEFKLAVLGLGFVLDHFNATFAFHGPAAFMS